MILRSITIAFIAVLLLQLIVKELVTGTNSPKKNKKMYVCPTFYPIAIQSNLWLKTDSSPSSSKNNIASTEQVINDTNKMIDELKKCQISSFKDQQDQLWLNFANACENFKDVQRQILDYKLGVSTTGSNVLNRPAT